MIMFLSTISVYILSFITAFIALKWYKNYKVAKNDSEFKAPPCLPHLPIIGSLWHLSDIRTFHINLMKKSKEIGNVIAFYMCSRYVIMLNGKKAIYEAFVKRSLCFSSRPALYLNDVFNPEHKGIAEHPYDDHFKVHHRICLNILRHFGYGQGIMESRIKIEVENLIQRIKLKNGKSFDPTFELTAAVSNVISSIIFGKPWSIDDPEFHEGIEITHEIVRGASKHFIVNFFPVLRFLPYYRECLKNVRKVIMKWDRYVTKILKKVINDTELESFCSMYLDELKKLESVENHGVNKADEQETKLRGVDQSQLKLTIRDLFLGGTETTATSLQWLIYFMANNPKVQLQIRNELDRVVGSKRLPSLADKPNLPITEATILELLRARTLIPLAVPHLTIKETVVEGVYIPKNVVVLANLYSANMDPELWDEPEKFKIERFLNEDRTKIIDKDRVISFSLGKRSCLGEVLARQELFLFTSSLIQHFEILPPGGMNEIVADQVIGATVSPTPFEARFIYRF